MRLVIIVVLLSLMLSLKVNGSRRILESQLIHVEPAENGLVIPLDPKIKNVKDVYFICLMTEDNCHKILAVPRTYFTNMVFPNSNITPLKFVDKGESLTGDDIRTAFSILGLIKGNTSAWLSKKTDRVDSCGLDRVLAILRAINITEEDIKKSLGRYYFEGDHDVKRIEGRKAIRGVFGNDQLSTYDWTYLTYFAQLCWKDVPTYASLQNVEYGNDEIEDYDVELLSPIVYEPVKISVEGTLKKVKKKKAKKKFKCSKCLCFI